MPASPARRVCPFRARFTRVRFTRVRFTCRAGAAIGRALAVGAWLAATQFSCLPGLAQAQTCGAAGGDNRPGTAQPCDSATASHPADGPATGTANSIDLVTGNKYLRERDAAWPGGLVLDRHYNSRNPFPRTLGTGWTHGYDTLLVRIERSGPPERPFDQQPAQLTGGMGGPAASRADRARLESGAATVGGQDPAAPAASSGARGRAGPDARPDAHTEAEMQAGGRRRRGPAAVELQILQADGRRLVFRAVREPGTPHGVVRYRAVSGDYGAISEQPGPAAERYHWRWRDGRRIRFDADGRMRRIDPPEGRPLVLDYRPDGRLDTVRAAGGLALRFEYGDGPEHAGSLRAVLLPDGQRVRYEHDALGLLVRATDAAGDQRRYRYDDPHQPHALTEVRDATDVVRGRFAYDAGGRAVASSLGGGAQAIRVGYTLPTSLDGIGESVVTDARDRTSRYRWRYQVHAHRAQWLSATGDGCEACPPVGLAYGYDGQGRLASAQHPDDGAGLRWRRDAQGRVIEVMRVDAQVTGAASAGAAAATSRAASTHRRAGMPSPLLVGGPDATPASAGSRGAVRAQTGQRQATVLLARIGYASDDPDAPPAYIERPSVASGRWHRLAWTRDAEGRIVGVRESGWTPIPASMDAELRAARFASVARDWRIERDTDGQPLVVDGPLPGPDDRLRYERDSAGRLLRVRRPAGLETRYERDRWGRVVATVDQDGIAQRWTRGADGRPLSLEIDGAMLRVGWGADPRQVSVESPATGPLLLRFDEADRLREVEDALGRRLRVERDAHDTITRYDVRDAAGAQLLALDPAAALAGPPAPSAPPTQPASHGRITWREAGGHGIAARDDFGRVVATGTPQGLRTLQAWDAADRMVAAVRSDGRAVRHRHDAAGRLIESGLPGRADLIRYRWLGGRLASVSDPWQTVAWQYDRHGRPIAEATLIGPREEGVDRLVTVVRTWTYDTQGRIASETLPGGHRLDYGHAADGRLLRVMLVDAAGRAQSLLDRFDWLPFAVPGQGLTGWSTGNGFQTRIGHDNQGRVASVRHAAAARVLPGGLPLQFTVSRDMRGRVVRTDRDGRISTYLRDGAGRLVGVASPDFVEGYAWDDDGNRLARVRQTRNGFQVVRQRFGRDGRLVALESLLPDGQVSRDQVRHDDGGRLVSGGRGADRFRLMPDSNGRPMAIADDRGEASLAAYNAFGQRVISVEVGARDGPVLYLHHAGRLQALLDRGGALHQWRVRVGERVLAVLAFDGAQVTPWFVHGDHAGRPVAISNPRGTVRALPARTPFGESVGFELDAPSFKRVALTGSDAIPPSLELRLPGGLLDGQLRDYDPSLGRWLQPDPLGAAAGINSYAFVEGDPVDRLDPSGLYQTDVHFYMTYFLARVAGLSGKQALTVANAAQYVDDNPATEPIPSTSTNWGRFAIRDGSHTQRLLDFHFTNLGNDPARVAGETDAQYAIRRASNPSNNRLGELLGIANQNVGGVGAFPPCVRAVAFGLYLHALQDTFAHRDPNNAPIPLYGGTGHGGYGESPDYTYNHVGVLGLTWRYNEARTFQMEVEVFRQLKNSFGLVASDRDGFPITFDQIKPVLVQFNAINESACKSPSCLRVKRALLDETLQRLGLGALPTYSDKEAAKSISTIMGN